MALRVTPERAVWGGLALALLVATGAGAWSLLRGAGAADRDAAGRSLLQAVGDYGSVPDFSLTERSGRTVMRRDLEGRFWVADFIFTRCAGMCPILTARMASLASSVEGDVRFVSFTVDPEWDTREVLGRYAGAAGPPDSRWLFLTGPTEDLYRVIGEGFRLNVARRQPGEEASGDLITHSDRFVLVDPEGRIRGYYHGTEEPSVRLLARDLERLRRERAR